MAYAPHELYGAVSCRPPDGTGMTRMDLGGLRDAAARILRAGLEAADPATLVRENLSVRGRTLQICGRPCRLGRGRLVLVAAGKAATNMARQAEEILGEVLDEGIVVDPSPGVRLGRARQRVAGHPLPDAHGQRAARDVLRLAEGLTREDVLLVLISGGASALLPAPVPGVSLADKAATTRALLHAGADIHALNAVRKHLSRIKGGRLAQAARPARVACLVLSDVAGDDLATIGSGPTVPDPTRFADARAALERHSVWSTVPQSVRRHIVAGMVGRRSETPKPGDPAFRRVHTKVIGSGSSSLRASARVARGLGFEVRCLTAALTGQAREVGPELVAALGRRLRARPVGHGGPVCLLTAGETTVTVRGRGRGGRNQELAVSAAEPLAGLDATSLIAALGTDGVDGNSPAAGGVADHTTVARARSLGLAPIATFLAENDSYALLASLGDAIITGPTGTNVADLVVLLASP